MRLTFMDVMTSQSVMSSVMSVDIKSMPSVDGEEIRGKALEER